MGGRRDAGSGLRSLPAVHELAATLDAPHALAVNAARRAIDEHRAALLGDRGQSVDGIEIHARARRHLAELTAPSLRRVLNATGVVIHTNLGRAPLAVSAQLAVGRAANGYGNLEFDLSSGQRGSRHDHVAGLLTELTEAQAAMVVNNGAGAVLLAAAALAGPGRAIVVSRGQQVEIGGGFRIPEVIAQSGSTMIEVGTTNRTHLRDYAAAVQSAPQPIGSILRVHKSNFRTLGFTHEVGVQELAELGVPVIDDVGSGVLSGGTGITVLADEPDLRASIRAGAALVCCSGDKLLGGPQAGLLLGTEAAVAAARAHPLARALRIDKLSLAALEATLALYRDPELARRAIPVLRMLDDDAGAQRRAQQLQQSIGPEAEVIATVSRAGGGALPLTELPGPGVALSGPLNPETLATRLRDGEPAVVARVSNGRLILDPRTLADEEIEAVAQAVHAALAAR